MKKYDTIDKIVKFMMRKHPDIKNTRQGVSAWKFLLKPNGSRVPFESSQGFKIIEFDVFDNNTLIIEQAAFGYEFHSQIKSTASSRLYLTNLAVINVYDHKTEFYSFDTIDFVYIVNTHESKIVMMQEWIDCEMSILRAQWTSPDSRVEQLLNEISVGRSVVQTESPRRLIDWR